MGLRSAQFHHSGELSAVGHGGHAARAISWLYFVPGRVRISPRVTPVLSVLKTVHHSAGLGHSGEFPPPAMALQ
jgi:hypothetical protein